MHDGMWHAGWMWIFWVVLVAFVAWGVIAVARAVGERRRDGSESAEAILKRRYARNEIDKVEYDRLLSDIRE